MKVQEYEMIALNKSRESKKEFITEGIITRKDEIRKIKNLLNIAENGLEEFLNKDVDDIDYDDFDY